MDKIIVWDEAREAQFKQLEKENIWFRQKYGHYIEKRGLNNWRNLFRKPTLLEWTILFMLIMALFIAWAYQHDIKQCRETLNNIDTICAEYKTTYVSVNNTYPQLNHSFFGLSNFTQNER